MVKDPRPFHVPHLLGAQAGLYYHFGLDKRLLSEKLFGVFEHRVLNRKEPLVRGFDDVFCIPTADIPKRLQR